MNVQQAVAQLLADPAHAANIVAVHCLPPQPARFAPFPAAVSLQLRAALARHGITQLYVHQAEAIEHVLRGRHVVVVTPTASGKTLCYNVPVLNAILGDSTARALYLFPTKALAQDQLAELLRLVETLEADIKTSTYDGDTPATARRAVRSAGHIVVTNPDMLHTGILPHHTRWVRLFENLRYVVIDELHHYRGVFGSHLANVIRRLRRLCAHYGSSPQFICCSATIANPGELASRLLDAPVEVINQNGAPSGEKHILFYNPPMINRQLGQRRSSLQAARDLAANFLMNNLQTIVFGRSRLAVELLLSYLREAMARQRRSPQLVQGYRGGYLPLERRNIERGLRDGSILGVVATNALELGIDIGGLQASVLCGYPGTVASAWQQMGRVGRRDEASVAVFVASSSPIDQYLVNHPDYFFGRSPVSGLVNPDNLVVLANHLKCAAFERPFEADESFGPSTAALLEFLEQEGVLHRSGQRWHWMDESYPAEAISLRSASVDNFVIVDQGPPARVIGEMDRPSVPTLLHEEAIYYHLGQQYQVERLDWEEKKAFVRPVAVDYYTDASLAVNLRVLEVADQRTDEQPRSYHGDVSVTWLATIFKKIKLHTHENIGWGKIHLPEESMHTSAYWLSLPDAATGGFSRDDLQTALSGLAHLLGALAPIYLMCDARDLGVVQEARSPFTGEPTVYVYERVPAGVGFSEKLFTMRRALLEAAVETARDCPCEHGCPSCVGPGPAAGAGAKQLTLWLLQRLTSEREVVGAAGASAQPARRTLSGRSG